ncbi:hypothetical protein BDN67DRAFT_180281 [Paxillus ammoniavirescens]|nr:hypothetical protein BDN67DRAFT_180281 [Paxillus ammoniavirescens]
MRFSVSRRSLERVSTLPRSSSSSGLCGLRRLDLLCGGRGGAVMIRGLSKSPGILGLGPARSHGSNVKVSTELLGEIPEVRSYAVETPADMGWESIYLLGRWKSSESSIRYPQKRPRFVRLSWFARDKRQRARRGDAAGEYNNHDPISHDFGHNKHYCQLLLWNRNKRNEVKLHGQRRVRVWCGMDRSLAAPKPTLKFTTCKERPTGMKNKKEKNKYGARWESKSEWEFPSTHHASTQHVCPGGCCEMSCR